MTKGKHKKKKAGLQGRASSRPPEGGDTGSGQEPSGESSAEDHRSLVAQLLGSIPKLEQRRAEKLQHLVKVMRAAGPAQCVAYASIVYLDKDPDTYKESDDDQSPAHVEYMALRALPMLEDRGTAGLDDISTLGDEALDLVRAAFADSIELIAFRSLKATQSPSASTSFEDYRRQALTQSLIVRGNGYAEYTKTILEGCFEGLDELLRTHLGFTADEAWRLAQAIHWVTRGRLLPRLAIAGEKYRELNASMKRQRRKKTLPPHLAALTPTQQKAVLWRTLFAEAIEDPLAIALVTADDLAAVTGLNSATCLAWLDTFHCPVDEYVEAHHGVPVGGHPLTRRPLLKLRDGYLAPAAMTIPDALRPRMEDALRGAGQEVWDRYEGNRSKWLENFATNRLQSVLPGSKSWTGVLWEGDSDSSDVDGLVSCDDLALRIQCKAGRVSPAARRGAPSMVEDITAVVSDGALQHWRLTEALKRQSPAQLGFSMDQGAALTAPLTIEIVVCLDDVTVWSTETHKLRHLVALPNTEQIPWVLSLSDLLATTELLEGAQFVHFLTRRQRIEREGRIEAHDELDWVGHYIYDGLFFDTYFEQVDPPDVFRLLSYTEEIDSWYFSRAGLTSVAVPKPSQVLPTGLRDLLHKLEVERPRHWLVAAVLLLNGDQRSRQLVETFMTHTAQRARVEGWSNASQVFYGLYGLTLAIEYRQSVDQLVRTLRQYADRKIAETECPNWVVVSLEGDHRLVVTVTESDRLWPIARVLMQRKSDSDA